jgi:hypothetical protein
MGGGASTSSGSSGDSYYTPPPSPPPQQPPEAPPPPPQQQQQPAPPPVRSQLDVYTWLSAAAQAAPARLAVVDCGAGGGGQRLVTYVQLHGRAGRLAALLAAQGAWGQGGGGDRGRGHPPAPSQDRQLRTQPSASLRVLVG